MVSIVLIVMMTHYLIVQKATENVINAEGLALKTCGQHQLLLYLEKIRAMNVEKVENVGECKTCNGTGEV
ncbi:MAG: hypothetical protein H8E00_00435 [Deltaproteobacteria bacterium]|nr:hypothetical protein [Deltaproteobacteria bacterium]